MWGWLLNFVISAVISYALKPDLEDIEADNDGALINKQSNLAQIPVIYGERKVGGTRVFVETSGTDNEYLYIALVLCEGEIDSIGSIYINDKLSTHQDYQGLVTINKHLGTDDQLVDSTLLYTTTTDASGNTTSSGAPSWTTDHRLRGVAYLGIRLKWNRDAFGSIPNIHAVVKGKKVRTFDASGQLTTIESYSENPAACLLDYLTNTRYGKGLTASDFEQSYNSFYSVYDLCEALSYTPYDGGNYVNLFTCNAIIKTDATVMSNVKVFLSGMRGLVPYSQGVYKLIVEHIGSPIFAFNEDHIIDGISFSGEKKSNRYNRVIATFVNPDNNWQDDQVEYPDAGSTEYTDFLVEDGGFDLEHRINLPTTTNLYEARNMAKTILKKSRQGIKCSFLSTAEALQLSVGDIVSVTHSTPGWVAKPFRITDLNLQSDGNVAVSLTEHQDDNYSWLSGAEAVIIPDTNLPDPYSVSAPTNLAVNSGENYQVTNDDGTTSPRVYLSWDASNDSFVDYYVAQISTKDGVWDIEHRTDSSPLYISGVTSGATIDVRVKAVNAAGISSAWLIINDHAIAVLVGGGSGGGVTTFSQNTAPTADLETGDLWFNTTNSDNILHRYNGTSWESLQDGTIPTGELAILDEVTSTEINVSELADISTNLGAITAGSINIGSGKFTVNSSGVVTITNGALNQARLEITSNTITVYDALNTPRVKIGQL